MKEITPTSFFTGSQNSSNLLPMLCSVKQVYSNLSKGSYFATISQNKIFASIWQLDLLKESLSSSTNFKEYRNTCITCEYWSYMHEVIVLFEAHTSLRSSQFQDGGRPKVTICMTRSQILEEKQDFLFILCYNCSPVGKDEVESLVFQFSEVSGKVQETWLENLSCEHV